MQTTSSAPDWAVGLVEQVCQDYKRALPKKLQWYDRSKREGLKIIHNEDGSRSWKVATRETTSGATWASGKIHISAGTNVEDQKLVLLHELAHHILNKSKKGRSQGHTSRFWKLAFKLYHQYGVDLEYSFQREKDYKVKATAAYQELVAELAAS